MSGSHKEFPKKAVGIQLGLAALVGIGYIFADKPAVHAMAEKVTKPVVVAAQKILAPIGKVEVKEEKTASAMRSGKEIYTSTCAVCHDNGVAGAPKLDESGTWETRLSGGYTALVASAIKGRGGMPARGGNPDISDSEMELTVSHMIKEAGIELVAKSAAGSAAPAPAATPAPAPAPTEEKAETKSMTEDSAKAEEVKKVVTETAKVVEEAKEEVIAETTKVVEEVKEEVVTETAKGVEEAKEEAVTETAKVVEEIKEEVVAETTKVVEEAKEEVVAETAKVEEVKTEAKQAIATAAAATTTAAVDHSKGEAIYKSSCFACHDHGVAGAPKIGDKEIWAPRIEKGIDALYASALKGQGAMPAKGGNANISDDEIKAVVDYMAAQVK